MNYLAHCYFADDNAESLIGNLAPDFLRGRGLNIKVERYVPQSELIRAGMERHRWIDIFTDEHAIFARSCRRFDGRFPHLSGIIVDVAYDHFLAKNWGEYHAQPLREFVSGVYATLQANSALCPTLLQHALPRMIEQNWLESYATAEGIALALTRMSARLKRPGCFDGCVDVVRDREAEFDADFREFFAALQRDVANRNFSK